MKKKLLILGLSSLVLFSCGNKTTTKQETVVATPPTSKAELPPVETKDKVTDLQPAFKGQTRIAGLKTKTDYSVTVLNKDLTKPWSVKALPDGRMLITEKAGDLRIIGQDGKMSEKITGLPKVNADGQGGLLDVCLDPDFATNRMVFFSFSEKTPKGNLTAVGKGKLSADEKKIENAQTIYRAFPAYNGNLHYGSRIVFDAQGNLYVSTGERSDLETRPQAQWLNSALGKVVRITKDGKPAAGNPFLRNSEAFQELYSYGHRNVQGLAIHPQTGDLWESEMGPKGGDEVNLIKPKLNYGWPTITYGVEYSGKTIGEGISQKAGMEQPVYYWDPVISPGGITFYHGGTMSEWENNLFISGLSSMQITRLVIKDNKVVGEERLLESEGERFRDVTQGQDGALYAITDSGKLYKITRK